MPIKELIVIATLVATGWATVRIVEICRFSLIQDSYSVSMEEYELHCQWRNICLREYNGSEPD